MTDYQLRANPLMTTSVSYSREDTFLVKWDYDKFDLDVYRDLGMSIDEISAEFDKEETATKVAELNEAETMKLDMLKGRLLGNGTSVVAEYRTMLRESMKYIIPLFERTISIT
jgi:hypothetical protein